ncbi:MAG: hypothetical protein ACRDKZ_03680 [Actinomycetota bacterium]
MSEALALRLTGSPFVLLSAMVVLAGLDFFGAMFAKEWAERHNHWLLAAGLLTFGALFLVYALSLEVTELSTVTFGWIVCLQIGVLLLERLRYGVGLPAGKWIAIAAILLLQAYLVLAPNEEAV